MCFAQGTVPEKRVGGLLFLTCCAPQEAAAGQLCPGSRRAPPHSFEEAGGARKGWSSENDSQSSGCALLNLQTESSGGPGLAPQNWWVLDQSI